MAGLAVKVEAGKTGRDDIILIISVFLFMRFLSFFRVQVTRCSNGKYLRRQFAAVLLEWW